MQVSLHKLPWYHHIALPDKLWTTEERRWYAAKVLENNWSCNVLVMQIESRLRERIGTAMTNFTRTLPQPNSDLARESFKDPYRFDFLGLTNEPQERKIEEGVK